MILFSFRALRRNKTNLARCHRPILAAALTLTFTACANDDLGARDFAHGVKAEIDWVRDAFGQKMAPVAKDFPNGNFPNIPNDLRPDVRSLDQRKALLTELTADQKTGVAVHAEIAKGDPTRYVTLNGVSPDAQPLDVSFAPAIVADGVRDLDSYDRTQPRDWFLLARIDYAEAQDQSSEDIAPGLQRAAALLRKGGLLRVIGYSASQRLRMGAVGPHETARALAAQRANLIAARLVAAGAPPRQILSGAAGEDVRSQGDRVEIIYDAPLEGEKPPR